MLLDVADLDTAFKYDVVLDHWHNYDLNTTIGLFEFDRELDEIKSFVEIIGTGENENEQFVDKYETLVVRICLCLYSVMLLCIFFDSVSLIIGF